jgi:hypothetical protein
MTAAAAARRRTIVRLRVCGTHQNIVPLLEARGVVSLVAFECRSTKHVLLEGVYAVNSQDQASTYAILSDDGVGDSTRRINFADNLLEISYSLQRLDDEQPSVRLDNFQKIQLYFSRDNVGIDGECEILVDCFCVQQQQQHGGKSVHFA